MVYQAIRGGLAGSTVMDAKGLMMLEGNTKPGFRINLHIKDLRDLKVIGSQTIVGEGAMPIAAIFRQLIAMGYAGCANLEYEIDAGDPLPGMKQSFAHMRGVLAGLGVSAR